MANQNFKTKQQKYTITNEINKTDIFGTKCIHIENMNVHNKPGKRYVTV